MKGSEVKAAKEHAVYQIAECYRMLNDCKQEEQWYAKTMKMRGADSAQAAIYYNTARKCQDFAQNNVPASAFAITASSPTTSTRDTVKNMVIKRPQKAWGAA